MRFVLFAALAAFLSLSACSVSAQEPKGDVELVSQDLAERGIRAPLLEAIKQARKANRITAFQAVRLRVATFSPAFLDRAQELCLVQLSFTEDGPDLPRTETGAIDEQAIDWEGLAAFLERVIPLLIDLLKSFGVFGMLLDAETVASNSYEICPSYRFAS